MHEREREDRLNQMAEMRGKHVHSIAACLLFVAYLLISYRSALTLTFINDDYIIMDKVRDSAFLDLWKPRELLFYWYRPFSREFHYWLLKQVAGHNETAYHIASFVLWIGVAALYFMFVRRIVNRSAAVVATAGVATLALWGAPLMWVAGAQDLWMLLFSLLFLHALSRSHMISAVICLLLALLSKESAAALPGIATVYLLLIAKAPLRVALRRSLVFWIVLVAWALVHPTLTYRLTQPDEHTFEAQTRPSTVGIVLRTVLAQFNIDDRLAPYPDWSSVLLRGAIAALLLGTAVFLALRGSAKEENEALATGTTGKLVAFGLMWAVIGWAPLFQRSIGWHAYYGSLGTLGFWLAVAALMRRYKHAALILICLLSLAREVRAATPSWDWGTYWFQHRAGTILGTIRERLFRLHPTLPPYSRLYFAHVPNHIGLLAGDGPAIRIWYDDSTLRARYYSAYARRAPADTLGADYFFRFDPEDNLVEVVAGTEDTQTALKNNTQWRHDHGVIASLFMKSGDTRRAAVEYGKLWEVYGHLPQLALFAATAFGAAADSTRARPFYDVAVAAYGEEFVHKQAATLIRALTPV